MKPCNPTAIFDGRKNSMKTRYVLQCWLLFVGVFIPTAKACHPVYANISGPTTVCVGQPITFLGGGSSCGVCDITSYSWSGAASGSDPNIFLTFGSPGEYIIYLTVTCSNGDTDSRSETFYVVGVGSVSASKTTVCTGENVTFTAVSNPANNWMSCLWWETRRKNADSSTWGNWYSAGLGNPKTGSSSVPGYLQYRARNGGLDGWVSSSVVTVVGVGSVSAGGVTSETDNPGASETVYVAKGSPGDTISVTAAPNPSGAWPSGKPTWNVSNPNAVPIDTAGTTTVTATCGTSSCAINIVVVEVGSIENDRNAVCLNDPNGIVFTAIAYPNGPLDSLQWSGRNRESQRLPWGDWGTVEYSSVSPNQIRLSAVTPGYYQFYARNGSDPVSGAYSREVEVMITQSVRFTKPVSQKYGFDDFTFPLAPYKSIWASTGETDSVFITICDVCDPNIYLESWDTDFLTVSPEQVFSSNQLTFTVQDDFPLTTLIDAREGSSAGPLLASMTVLPFNKIPTKNVYIHFVENSGDDVQEIEVGQAGSNPTDVCVSPGLDGIRHTDPHALDTLSPCGNYILVGDNLICDSTANNKSIPVNVSSFSGMESYLNAVFDQAVAGCFKVTVSSSVESYPYDFNGDGALTYGSHEDSELADYLRQFTPSPPQGSQWDYHIWVVGALSDWGGWAMRNGPDIWIPDNASYQDIAHELGHAFGGLEDIDKTICTCTPRCSECGCSTDPSIDRGNLMSYCNMQGTSEGEYLRYGQWFEIDLKHR